MGNEDLLIAAFDGECLLCNRSVRFLAQRDRHKRLRFVPLQSPLGAEMERLAGSPERSTMIMRKGDQVLSKSDGVLTAIHALGGIWAGIASFARIFPLFLRDAVYDFIAARRISWFGKADVCSLPTDAVRERLLSGEGV